MRKSYRLASLAALAAGTLALAACGGQEREAEATVEGATAEVTTNKPESQVSDQQLENAAAGAAAAAATPQASASVVVTPPEGDPVAKAAGVNTSGEAAPTAGGAGVTTADAHK